MLKSYSLLCLRLILHSRDNFMPFHRIQGQQQCSDKYESRTTSTSLLLSRFIDDQWQMWSCWQWVFDLWLHKLWYTALNVSIITSYKPRAPTRKNYHGERKRTHETSQKTLLHKMEKWHSIKREWEVETRLAHRNWSDELRQWGDQTNASPIDLTSGWGHDPMLTQKEQRRDWGRERTISRSREMCCDLPAEAGWWLRLQVEEDGLWGERDSETSWSELSLYVISLHLWALYVCMSTSSTCSGSLSSLLPLLRYI
jgi:hypothetical protein